jgi:MFS family permease
VRPKKGDYKKMISNTNTTQSKNKSSYLPWIVWSLGCLFYFYENLIQVSLGVMSSELMRDFAVTSQTLGVLAGVYFYFYAFMQLPSGIMLDYFGPKRLLITATTICAISTIAFSLTDNFLIACAARLMIGFGSAFAVVGTMKLATNWFSVERFAFLTGLMVAIGMMGSIAGEAPLSLLIENFGWRNSMTLIGLVGFILALMIYFVVSDTPRTKLKHENANEVHEKGHMAKNLISLTMNKQLWLTALYGGLMYMSTPVFCGLWGPAFLMEKMSISKTMAAGYISLAFVGWVIGSPLWGYISNRIGRRKPPMYVAAIGCLVSTIVFIYLPTNEFWLQVSLFLFGFFSAGFLPAFSVANELCNRQYVATGLSFMNMMNQIGIAIVNPVIGSLLDKAWTGNMSNGAPSYSLEAYQSSLAILPIALFAALLILPFIRETYCKSVYEPS